jgi:hypothetical protein
MAQNRLNVRFCIDVIDSCNKELNMVKGGQHISVHYLLFNCLGRCDLFSSAGWVLINIQIVAKTSVISYKLKIKNDSEFRQLSLFNCIEFP